VIKAITEETATQKEKEKKMMKIIVKEIMQWAETHRMMGMMRTIVILITQKELTAQEGTVIIRSEEEKIRTHHQTMMIPARKAEAINRIGKDLNFEIEIQYSETSLENKH
jgi:hypothetical protein